MPTFTFAYTDLATRGPVIEMHVAVDTETQANLEKAKLPVPAPFLVKALLETGSSATTISQEVAAALGLHPVHSTLVSSPAARDVERAVYSVRLLFPNSIVFEGLAIEEPLPGQDVQCVIGRDILQRAVFIYNGTSGVFSVSF
jgi:hypothetical protein